MKIKSFCKIITLALFIPILLFSLQAFAGEKGILRVQGSLMEIHLGKNMMVVNERVFIWDKKTVFVNESGAPITPDQLKIDRWVYIEAERVKKKTTLIKELRLLPK